jgi:hypothetical protein
VAATCRDILQKQVKSFIRIWQDVLLVFCRYVLLQDLASYLWEDVTEAFKRLRQSETTGRPLGSEDWIEKLTAMTGREFKAKKRGPKKVNGGS